ncbi:uncharacterized protein RB166_011670 isoform 2-T2 [Leptodactylus fuscus]|uniref:uncharacterized protein LOC142209264 isoform X2 n=1 Tax=Leptodactylus fuscus TaxID=238119 RepID=UPI003F4F1B10
MRGHLLLVTAYAIIVAVCSLSPFPSSTDHWISHDPHTDPAHIAHPTDSHTAILKTHESHTAPPTVGHTISKTHVSTGVHLPSPTHKIDDSTVHSLQSKVSDTSHDATLEPTHHENMADIQGHDATLEPTHHENMADIQGHDATLEPTHHENMADIQGSHTVLPPDDEIITSNIRAYLSEPAIQYSLLESKAVHITCFSKSGPLPIQYQLFINGLMREEKLVHKPESANFTIPMRPGIQIDLKCKAISPYLHLEKSSESVTLRGGDPEESAGTPEEAADKKEKYTGLEHLIPLQYILTSVTPEVLARNSLVLTICGPIFLVLLVIFIFVSYFRCRKEHRRTYRTAII